MAELRQLAPNAGSYVAESNVFEPDWQQSFWGPNYPRLQHSIGQQSMDAATPEDSSL